jgi:hypothetical protein
MVAEEAVRALTTPRLSSRQSQRLFRAFFRTKAVSAQNPLSAPA